MGEMNWGGRRVRSWLRGVNRPIQDSKSQKPQAWNLELGTWNLELGTWNLELKIGPFSFPALFRELELGGEGGEIGEKWFPDPTCEDSTDPLRLDNEQRNR
jgi:hypothetical protein